MTGRWLAGLCVVLSVLASIPATAVAMSRDVGISTGSFFAAALRCEAENLITPGQTDELLAALDPYLSKADKRHIAAGRARGTKDSEVFIDTEKRWMTFAPDTANCYRVQGVLDDYKAQLGE